MILKPRPLSDTLPPTELKEDTKRCKRFGPCGAGAKALYLNSFFLERRYYIPFGRIQRVYKRIAMSKGGFTGKGVFASIPYLVVEFDNGKEKQCNFKYEEQVDQLLTYLEKEHPEIKLVSAAAEKRLAERERKLAMQKKPDISPQARKNIEALQKAADYLDKKPELALELSQSARKKRSFMRSNPSYRWVALIITLMGLAALIYGIYLFAQQGSFAVYFTLLGLAAIFMFSGASVLPTAKNNKKAVMERAQRAQKAMADYIGSYPDFPLPARYAHPVVLKRMQRAIESGRAVWPTEALEVVKKELKALNSNVEVEQEEYDEVVAIKAMFLNEDYQ